MTKTKTFKAPPPPKPCADFQPQDEHGRDPLGRQLCGTCRHWGKPDDARHAPRPTPTPRRLTRRQRQYIAAAAELDARRLGEHD